jgi:mRNA interferase HicA
MKAKQFIQKLRKCGVEIIEGRGKGGHYLARFQGKQATVPVHGDADMGNIFLKKICKQLGIHFEDL